MASKRKSGVIIDESNSTSDEEINNFTSTPSIKRKVRRRQSSPRSNVSAIVKGKLNFPKSPEVKPNKGSPKTPKFQFIEKHSPKTPKSIEKSSPKSPLAAIVIRQVENNDHASTSKADVPKVESPKKKAEIVLSDCDSEVSDTDSLSKINCETTKGDNATSEFVFSEVVENSDEEDDLHSTKIESSQSQDTFSIEAFKNMKMLDQLKISNQRASLSSVLWDPSKCEESKSQQKVLTISHKLEKLYGTTMLVFKTENKEMKAPLMFLSPTNKNNNELDYGKDVVFCQNEPYHTYNVDGAEVFVGINKIRLAE